ncbi:MAG: DHH family phosphoesterase [Methanobacterium sp.]|uniref:single-stranded-DNA-specific exonuclease RecJ n=1 Tax=Methanobacterium sp. TaxID=2164 RepID=UPI003D65F43F|nr:DHH family phosphoesterase [Methanobacterium sp.]
MDVSKYNLMEKAFLKAHELVRESEDIQIYSHIDCDGITAGAILSSMLDRLDKDHKVDFITLDKIDNLEIESELTIFSDLGSGQKVDQLGNKSSKILILDHHPPLRPMNYADHTSGKFLEINPHYYGIDGSHEVSGGGMCYLLARTFEFYDLSWLGVLSAVGDMQNGLNGKLIGLNKEILSDSIQNELVSSTNDLSIYGRQTRPIFVALSYFGDVKLPITNNRTECIHMLKDLGIPTKNGRNPRVLYDLTQEEKGKIFSELVKMLSREVPQKYIKHVPKLVSGESYDFLREKKYSPLRDASEFSTAVNACSRHKHPDIALNVLKGDRGFALDEMDHLALEHRRYLAQKMDWVREEDRIIHLNNLQYFDGSEIKSEVIGTVAGMILSYGDWRKPIIGFTPVGEDGEGIKISLRCSRLLAYDGIHFGDIIRKIAAKTGGNGGGHSVACGAYIPEENMDKFLKIFDEYLTGKI